MDLPEAVSDLQALIVRLRQECPWDRKQTHESLKRHLMEEAYEVLEALDHLEEGEGEGSADGKDYKNYKALQDELGDLLYQIFFHSLLASEAGHFEIQDVIRNIHDKLYRRHPHVFGDLDIETTEELAPHWEEIKKAEKKADSVMDGLPQILPALVLAAKVQKKANALFGSADFSSAENQKPDGKPDRKKIEKQIDRQIRSGGKKLSSREGGSRKEDGSPSPEKIRERKEIIGDLLWSVVGLAVELEIDPEDALRKVSKKSISQIREAEMKLNGNTAQE